MLNWLLDVAEQDPEPFVRSVGNKGRAADSNMRLSMCSRSDVKEYSFSQRTIDVWNNLSTNCGHASSVNMFKNRIDKFLVRAGYT